MQTSNRCMRDLMYDPHETREAFGERKQRALEAGRTALRERRISGDLYLFYEYLVERVGGNKYTWVSEETLATAFTVDSSTIKRWIAKLVRAALIRRQRQFATSSRTYITAYDPECVVLDGAAEQTSETESPSGEREDAPHPTDAPPQDDQGSNTDDRSFRRKHAPTFGANMRRDHIKVDHRSSFGGGQGISFQIHTPPDPRIIQVLEREGAHTLATAPRLHHKPLEELDAVSRYLDTQRNIQDRPKLFAWLVLRDFGAQLLNGHDSAAHSASQRPNRYGRTVPKRQAGTDHQRYFTGELRHLIQGWGEADYPSNAGPPPQASVRTAAQPHVTGIWEDVLDRLRSKLPAMEFAAWFDGTTLYELTPRSAIVTVPNVLAREKLATDYAQEIRQALYLASMHQVQVQIVIDQAAANAPTPAPDPSPAMPSPSAETAHTLSADRIWQQVLGRLRQVIPTSEFLTWFDDATLVDLTAERAVVGIPNIFAREKLTNCYQEQLADALSSCCGQPVRVQVELVC